MTYTEIIEECKGLIKMKGLDLDLLYDDGLYRHCMNVAYLSVQLGMKLGLDLHELIALGMGALLHDIGKIELDPLILNKPGKLTEEERLLLEIHPVLGYHYLSTCIISRCDNEEKVNKSDDERYFAKQSIAEIGWFVGDTRENSTIPYHFPQIVMDIVLYHHEKLNGTGYPAHKTDIPLMVQIVTVADIYEAIRAKRVYRDANSPKDAYQILKGMSGLNSDIVEILGNLI